MTGWIIYSDEDVQKNKNYIQMYVDEFSPYGINIELMAIYEAESINIKKKALNQIIHCKTNLIKESDLESVELDKQMNFELPAFAINRSRRADIAEVLESKGVKVFNSHMVTQIANDKGRTYDFLKGIVSFMPVMYEGKIVQSIIQDNGFGYPYVMKSCGGHGGSQVYMISNEQEKIEACELLNGEKYITQQCCSDLGRDVRVYIVGNKIVAAVLRSSDKSFKSNYSLGGRVEKYNLNERENEMVEAIIKKLPLDYAGIDFTFHNGKAVFNEIEDAVGARMLYKVSDIDIVKKFVQYIVTEINRARD